MAQMKKENTTFEDDPLWYKDAIIYQLHVRAFCDSASDGVGDFTGLTEKLDYFQSLGVTAIWLLPFYPSPLKDDGYDISDYTGIHPAYGTMRDFKELLREAHERGLRVITELVLNHTSDQHHWFQRARHAPPDSRWRDFYVWSDTPDRYKDARVIFKDFESSNWAWDPVAKAYYWHRFYSHQPDLNYDNPRVQKAMFHVVDFWLGMGVDGLRLDAVPYLFEREGTNCENLPETHAFLKRLRAHVDSKFRNRLLLAEANQWPEDTAVYFGAADECQMAFHFPIMPRLFMGLQMEDRFPITDVLEQTPSIPDSCQWAMFLRNHDELTLEMVTDEERDYMYRSYAGDPRQRINLGIRRRLAPLMSNNRRKIELMNILLFSFPGTPILYYGDEIGMGDNYYLGDRDGMRTPMQWSPDRNAGFSKANPQKLYLPVIIDPEYHYEALNVENQERNPSSLLWWMRRVIAMRKRFKAFGRGSIEFVRTDNTHILAFVRRYEDEAILAVINLSRFAQVVRMYLAKYAGCIPEETFSQNSFPLINEEPYTLTLGPNDHYWFLLSRQREATFALEERVVPELGVNAIWSNVFEGDAKESLEEDVMPAYLKNCRWFGGKPRTIREVVIIENAPLNEDFDRAQIVLLQVAYSEGSSESYLVPMSYAPQHEITKTTEEFRRGIIAHLRVDQEPGILYDSVYDQRFRDMLLDLVVRRKKEKMQRGELAAYPGKIFPRLLAGRRLPLPSYVLKQEQNNTSILYENIIFLKLFRRLESGVNPDSEILKFLTEWATFLNAPLFAGAIEYRRPDSEPVTLGLIQNFVPTESDAWTFTTDNVGRFFERVLSRRGEMPELPKGFPSILGVTLGDIPPLTHEIISGFYLEMASLLGRRTAELHLSLASCEDRDFCPEPFSKLYQRAVYQSMRGITRKAFQSLEENVAKLPDNIRKEASDFLPAERDIMDRLATITQKKISGMKIRIHGDYHLRQVLYTGKDFIIIDFEGDPSRPLSERRLKRSAFRDVASMIRSLQRAAYCAFLRHTSIRPEDTALLEPWLELWSHCVSGIFLRSYLDMVGTAPFLPKEREELEILLQAFLLDKAVHELSNDLSNRPELVIVPIRGIKKILLHFPSPQSGSSSNANSGTND